MSKSKKEYTPRHAAAFILLFLARSSDYGGSLLATMKLEMPHFLGDSAMLYRTLRHLEGEGCIVSQWEIQDTDQPKRIYSLTARGWERLDEYAKDIQMRLKNFQFFLATLETVQQTHKVEVEVEVETKTEEAITDTD